MFLGRHLGFVWLVWGGVNAQSNPDMDQRATLVRLKKEGLSRLQVNQMDEVDCKAGHCG